MYGCGEDWLDTDAMNELSRYSNIRREVNKIRERERSLRRSRPRSREAPMARGLALARLEPKQMLRQINFLLVKLNLFQFTSFLRKER